MRRRDGGVEAEAVLWTQGNLAFVVGSKDGLFADDFRQAYMEAITY